MLMDQNLSASNTPPVPVPSAQQTSEHTDSRLIITVLLLVFAFPIGVIFTWMWMKWPKWVKIVLTLPFIIFILGIVAAMVLVAVNPAKQLNQARQAQCVSICNDLPTSSCVQDCIKNPPQK